jgi:ribosomal protein S18 acetylase RimI-like enzyme
VTKNFQGKGIGKILLFKVEEYCVNNNICELRMPTQKENVLACTFYIENGYKIIEETSIKHYWRNFE